MSQSPLNSELRLKILAMIYKIRFVEEGIAERYPKGEMRCPTHLSIGQEGVPSVLSVLLTHQDLAVSTHRSHAHYLAKGGDMKAMLAEIYGREGGCSGGRGGSMHLIDESVGFKGSTAIVGNTIPIGVGLGLSIKLRQQNDIAIVFVGDGAIEEGVFYEAANFAAVQKLPVLFVCENNLYSVYAPLRDRQPEGRAIYRMVEGMGLQTSHGDGNNIDETYHLLSTAINAIKMGQGPQFVELETYRWREHCGPFYDNDLGYRTENEFLEWKERDPLTALEKQLLRAGEYLEADLSALKKRVLEEVDQAFEYVQGQPYAESSEAYSNVYCNPMECSHE
ncbi:thiamine pyrophosphate-dependent dehydrogenase E1 component subunit alpha [Marinomonas fungiae]|uniref:thiamine pyrophosphate-dependent dehydrogenase E1 component subunit alpha n=1 Tax=Marinomonas fungiae TaxID=1137284 RepID=UPI003A94C3D9